MSRPRILIVESDFEKSHSLAAQFTSIYGVEFVENRQAAIERVQRNPVLDLVLLNIEMSHIDGLETQQCLRQFQPSLNVITFSSSDDPCFVAQTVRLNMENCVPQPCDKSVLLSAVSACSTTTRNAPHSSQQYIEELGDGSFFVAVSPAIRRLRAQVDKVAHIDIPVLCLGESGTGKEVIARLVHRQSYRGKRTFLKVNCAAMPCDLLESEMFGYERGAFTGAVRSKPGKFELCHGGTILLDEIGEMPPALQAKLLHVLQDQEFTRLGGSSKVKVDVRILSATNVNIKSALSAKTFREDLYYRLSTFVFFVPPLRERREDIPLLLDRYVALYGARYGVPCRPLSAGLLERCLRYHWPGNVRELENFAKRYLILGDDAFPSKNNEQNANDCTGAVPNSTTNTSPICEDLNSHVRNLKGEAEITAIGTALKQTNWNRKQAARVLNISYKSLLGKIQRYGIGYQPSSE